MMPFSEIWGTPAIINTWDPGNVFYVLDAAPSAPNFRYDLFVLGEDENMDYIKGTAGDPPVMPSVPADHVKLCHVMLVGGMTEILNGHINGLVEARLLQTMVFTPSSGTGTITLGEFVWHLTNNTPNCNIKVDFKDQYGFAIGVTDTITLTKQIGIGQVYSGDDGWQSSAVSQTLTGQTSYTFKYERDQLGSEISPVFTLTFADDFIEGAYRQVLLDSGGLGIA